MVAAIDTGLEFYRQVLALRGYRQEVLSADIANASTPGFKGVDLDFAHALDAVVHQRDRQAPAKSQRLWLVDDPRQLAAEDTGGDHTPAAAASFIKYQTGSEVSLDGNSVDLDQEKTTAADNAVQYEAATTFATQTIRMLTIAINGSGSQQSGGS